MRWILAAAAVFQCITCLFSQRVAPGVPPQQYHDMPPQHQPPPPQYQQQQPPQQQQQYQQQQQFQQHQAPVQPQHQQGFQQPPPQQQGYQQPPQQQAPQGHPGPGQHGGHHGNHQVLNTQNLAHEKEHIAEHMDVPIDTSKMSEAELQFHYFKMHDADNNNKLDGCELIKSLIHWHDSTTVQVDTVVRSMKDEEISNLIDPALETMDKNNDGFIDFVEFKQAGAGPAR